MAPTHRIRTAVGRICLIALLAGLASASFSSAHGALPAHEQSAVVELQIHYLANGHRRRMAYVILPRWYGLRDDPPLPLVIAPHGAGPGPFLELGRAWGDLPARGRFALVIPEGQGRVLAHYSWGYSGQIDDLARMPAIVRKAIRWLRIDANRIYAVGGSMGGQESLLLVARYPHLLAGAVSFDAPGDMALRYRQYAALPDAQLMRGLLRTEIGGTPDEDAADYAARSPVDVAGAIARSGVPVQIWWSTCDRLVVDQRLHSGRLYTEITRLDPPARVTQVVGTWAHTAEMRWNRRLPDALRFLGLLEPGT
jgi:poly(3-hydroxybutyrate) depolymerase